ncbi:hypothetical protein HDV02_004934 [Globomyces sp. JEL0801]|nr:hypothetical protein HDV02_004934 [Globomyces sp. JEL0801]
MASIFDLRITNFTYSMVSGLMVAASSDFVVYTNDIILAHVSNFLDCCTYGLFLLYQDPFQLDNTTKFIFYIIAQIAAVTSDVLLLYLLMKLAQLYNIKQVGLLNKIALTACVTGSLCLVWYKACACVWIYGKLYKLTFNFINEPTLLGYGIACNLHILFFTTLHLYLIFQETKHKKRTKEVFALLFIRSAKTSIFEFLLVVAYFAAAIPPINQIPAISQKVTNILSIAIKAQIYMLFVSRIKRFSGELTSANKQ